MSFLTPLFLLGALAIAGPVIFHLIRRTTRERTVFSSLLFLKPTPPRLTKRSRIENWLLLALRCLALGLLALGFARPFFPKASAILPADNQSKRIILLVDTSASLQRAGAWATAQERVAQWTRQLGNVSELAVITFDRTVQTQVSFAEWKGTPPGDRAALVRGRLNSLKPSWAGTQLATALVNAAEALTEPTAGPEPQVRQIVLISDLQEGSHAESLQAYEWPKGVELLIDPVAVRPAGNASLQLITEEATAIPSSNAVVRVRISNTADATLDQFEVGWLRPEGTGFLGTPAKTYVPAGQSRTLALPVPEGVTVERIGLTGDPATYDNVVQIAPPEVSRARILYVGNDDAGLARQPLFFLRRAFPEGSRPVVNWTLRSPGDLSAAEATAATGLTIVTSPLSTTTAAALRSAVTAGGTVLYVMDSPAGATGLGELLGVPAPTTGASTAGSMALLVELDFRHPLFAPFADSRFSDFTKIRLWRHQRLDLTNLTGARLLARLDSGDPGVVEVPVGRGRVVVLPWGWTPADSQWVLSTKFVPFLHALLEYSGAVPPVGITQQLVGEPLVLPANPSGVDRRMRRPDGTEQSIASGATNFTETLQPGIYRLLGAGEPVALAVNLDPAESRTLPTVGEELERLGAPLGKPEAPAAELAARREHIQATEAEGQQKLWRWFLGATILTLLLETAAAGWSARKSHSTVEATA